MVSHVELSGNTTEEVQVGAAFRGRERERECESEREKERANWR
jgi:hypothetical protein